MTFMGVFTYVLSVLLAITAAVLIRRIYTRGSRRVRAGLTGGAILVLGVAVLVLIFGP
jgi:hypothetical protein